MRDYKKELKEDLAYARQNDLKFVLVEANLEKGFSYSYLAYIPNKPQSILMIDCLNDYESEMPEGHLENLEGMEEIYRLFQSREIIRSNPSDSNKKEETKDQTLDRMYYRLEKGVNALSNMIGINPNSPAIVPLIPGYGNEQFESVVSQLDKDVISKTAPQIKAMIEDARKIIEDRTGIEISDKVIPLGHSKSATFANNFSAYYPEMCEASILGGGNFGTLPIDEIALQIVPDDKITDSEKFMIENGKITKKITQCDFDRIIQEYNDTKRDYQGEITINEDGTYNLPMNFPIGIADIEHYRVFSNFPDGKEGYRKALSNMPKMIFIGEHEDTKPGHYAYMDGKTAEGIDVKAGDDISLLEGKFGRPITEIEMASMYNRVLEYIVASNVLFGRSSNERLESYMQLYSLLNIPVQSKIYEGVGHTNYEYSSDIEGLDGISSKGIYTSQALKNDIAKYYNGVIQKNPPILDDNDRATQISPIPQIIRRYIASGKDVKFLSGVSEGQMMNALKKYIDSQSGLQCKNINRVYDTISASEISSILQTLGRNEVVQNGKNGLNDCMQDGTVRISTEQEATRMVKETVLNKEKELDEAEQQK